MTGIHKILLPKAIPINNLNNKCHRIKHGSQAIINLLHDLLNKSFKWFMYVSLRADTCANTYMYWT